MTEEDKSILIGCSTIAFAIVGVVMLVLAFTHKIVWAADVHPVVVVAPKPKDSTTQTAPLQHSQ